MKNSDIDRISMQLERGRNLYIDKCTFGRLSSQEKKILADNAKYKNRYKGKKCFILGNGPSVNKVNFGDLKNELVITVNDMFRHKNFPDLNSDFHFIADPFYLKLNRQNKVDAETIERMSVLSKTNTVLYMPIEALKIVKQYGWNSKINIRYFSSKLSFYDGYKEQIDFARYIPAFQAVVHWGIVFAMYLGCSEIYLLGCDATNIVVDISLFMEEATNLLYAYDLSEEDVKLTKKRHRRNGLEYLLYGYWRIVHLFSELYLYCKRNNVKLYNCSEESLLDSIPKRKLDEILKL